MFTLDASVVSRSIDPNDPDYATCKALLDHLDRHAIPIILPRLFLAEVAGVIRRILQDPIRARLAAEIWQTLPNVRIIPLDDLLMEKATNIAADYALRGADAVYVAVARDYDCILVSLDREQRERATSIVRTLKPAEVLAQLA
jgi:predicted nucleic acid-binding protein